jgi:hypothetical protein
MVHDPFPLRQPVRSLQATVPCDGPGAPQRRQGRLFQVRIVANESAYGISPLAMLEGLIERCVFVRKFSFATRWHRRVT